MHNSRIRIVGSIFLTVGLLQCASGQVIGWGNDVVPSLENVVSICMAPYYSVSDLSLALKADGTVVAWTGVDGSLQPLPDGLTNVVAIRGGGDFMVALKADRTMTVWFPPGELSFTPPDLTNVVAVAAGEAHGLALTGEGTVVGWGNNSYGQTNVPPGLSNVVAIAAGTSHSLALRADGTVAAWGMDWYNQCKVPAGLSNVIAVAAGDVHSLALKADGTVVAWGAPYGVSPGLTNVPPDLTNVIAIAAGASHSLALKADGTVVTWGSLPNLPFGLTNVVAVAAGDGSSLALVGRGPPFLTSLLADQTVAYRATARLRITASGAAPLSYQWQFNGTNLPAATNALLELADVQFSQAGSYSVVVSNALGRVESPGMILHVVPLLISAQPRSLSTFFGATATFSVAATAQGPFDYQWQFNGTNLPGANASSLRLTGVRADQAGIYSVMVRNSLGSVSSVGAELLLGQVAAWGDDGLGETDLPPGLTNIVAVESATTGSFVLRSDGRVFAWGPNFGPALTEIWPGVSNIISMAVASYPALALRSDGTVIAWGGALTNVPSGVTNVVQVAITSGGHSGALALRADGTVVAWDPFNGSTVTNLPPGLTNVVSIRSGWFHYLALKTDGTVVTWGDNRAGQMNVPVGLADVASIGAGDYHSLAIKTDGTLVVWGSYGDILSGFPGPWDPAHVPKALSGVIAAVGGGWHSLALKQDGTVVAWGDSNLYGQLDAPTGLRNVIAISSRDNDSLALIGDAPAPVRGMLINPVRDAGDFSCSLLAQSGKVYRLEYKNLVTESSWTALPLAAGKTGTLRLTDFTPSGSQRYYRVRSW